MSIITLQLGQYGNQVGYEFFSAIIDDIYLDKSVNIPKDSGTSTGKHYDYEDAAFDRFFYSSSNLPIARAIMIDTEAKVVDEIFTKTRTGGAWSYNPRCCISQKQGSGNNWALGYCMEGNDGLIRNIMESVRWQVEQCDSLGGFLLLMSLAGGTGSGLGTRCTEELVNYYPDVHVFNQVVWPYAQGEVIVQDYNTLLTLSHLYETSTGLIMMENDKLHEICTRLLKMKNVSFKHINKVITHKLAGSNALGTIAEHLCSHTDYKLLNIIDIPQVPEHSFEFTSFNWYSLLKHLHQMLIANAAMEENINWQVQLPSLKHSSPSERNSRLSAGLTAYDRRTYNKSVSNMLTLRGTELDKVDLNAYRDPRLYVDWIPESLTFSAWGDIRPYGNYEKSAFLLSNSQFCIPSINSMVEKAWSMFTSRAYVHQYVSRGVSEESFFDSFATVEQTIANYNAL